MKPWLNDGFSQSLWDRDVASLTSDHRPLARRIFEYATDSLGSEPFQRESSRTGRSDGQTIFRTRLHRSFWLVLDMKSTELQLHFPDKEDLIQSAGRIVVERAPGTQWERKKEKRVRLPYNYAPGDFAELLGFVDRVHDAAVEYYSRGKDYSLTLQTLMGQPTGGEPLAAPDQATFARLLGANPKCATCGRSSQLSIVRSAGGWSFHCDDHHPTPSAWRHMATLDMPFDVKRVVWHRDGGKCVSCGSANYATFDHMIPANRGGGAFSGSHTENNVRLKCRTCNFSKNNKFIP